MQFNSRKLGIVCLVAAGLGALTVSYQNFTSGDVESISSSVQKDSSIGDSLSAALQTAEQDHLEKQMAMNVEPSQVEKSLRRGRSISTVEIQTDNVGDTKESAQGVPQDDNLDLEDAN